MSKRADKPYVSRRTLSWIKIKCSGRDEFVIGGWRPSSKKDRPFASLLLGEFEGDEFHYRGRVGTGFDNEHLAEIARKLNRLARSTSPFADAPAAIPIAHRRDGFFSERQSQRSIYRFPGSKYPNGSR